MCAGVPVECVLALGKGLPVWTCPLACPFPECGVSHLIFGCQVFTPVASAARAMGPRVLWSQAQAGHAVSPSSLWSPGPPPAFPTPFGGSPSTVRCPQALTARILPPALATWTHRCQVKLTPGLKAPAPPSRGQEAVASITQTAPH